jgi:subtilisin family serine protease
MKIRNAIILNLATLAILWPAPLSAWSGKLDSSLRLLRCLRKHPVTASRFEPRVQQAAAGAKVDLAVKFDHVLSRDEIAAYEAEGLSFYYIDGEIARTRTIYPVRVLWARLEAVSARKEILRMESTWKPCLERPLDVSNPEVEADVTWPYTDPLGAPLTGKGIRIADFDTGIDIFHPSFFFADGDTIDWLDCDSSGDFTPGTDAVDINGNGMLDINERMRFTDGLVSDYAHVFSSGNPSNDDGVYQTYWDWLYADSNRNGSRDFGPSAGFTEGDPTYGEPLFIALDDNENGALDVGEKLVALGTSKVVATLSSGNVTRTRGIDLIYSETDQYGHGAPVAGVLAGGTPGRHRFCGIAPEAELIAMGQSTFMDFAFLIPWARSQGADIMLHEWSQFIFTFLDGTSLEEELITAEHQTIVQVVPSGNLTGGGKHSQATIAGGDSVLLKIAVPTIYGDLQKFYLTLIWLPAAPVDLDFLLVLPSEFQAALDDTVLSPQGYYVWNNMDVSPRGTHKLDMMVERGSNTSVNGTWHLKIINNSVDPAEVFSKVADQISSWSGGTMFESYVSNDRNVVMPATSDSALVNGSYSTRGFESYYGTGGGSVPPGELSPFSGRGERIDMLELVDICAPGNYDIFSARSHQDYLGYPVGSYQQFSGTSAAAPHVAAAAALLLQSNPSLHPYEVEQMLASGALEDGFTGPVYNSRWGYGKLRILSALNVASSVQDMADGKQPPRLCLDQNYPNPFNPTTWIPFYLPEDGTASIIVYNVRGELVKVLRNQWYLKGPHSVRWDGRNARGIQVSSGIYFCMLRQGGREQTKKMVLLR